ncbi:MAG: ABC transporter permease [Betaproteobacteria bacterium]
MNSLARFVVRRLALLVLTLFAVSVLIFSITQLLPGDVATMILGMQATPQDLATLRAQLGLDQPAIVQFGRWLAGILQGDLGTSTRFQRPVIDIIGPPLRNSLVLGAAGILFAVPLGLALGLFCALRRNSAADYAISSITIFAAAMPEFVTGGLMIIVFSTWLGWLPPFAGAGGTTRTLVQSASELIMPVASLSLVILAYILRMMRASTVEVLDSAFVKAALLKGLDRRRVILFHVLPVALGPTLSVIALSIGWMAGGLVIVESLFGYPGIGRMLVFVIRNRDVPLLQAITLIIAAVYAIANLAADIGQRLLDPRVGTA